jgi:DNA-binding HxlR family transcriptional regulator
MQDEPMGGKGCPLRIVGCLISSWKAMVSSYLIHNLGRKDEIRFNVLKRSLTGINSNGPVGAIMELEHIGLVSKKIYPEIPPRVEYNI